MLITKLTWIFVVILNADPTSNWSSFYLLDTFNSVQIYIYFPFYVFLKRREWEKNQFSISLLVYLSHHIWIMLLNASTQNLVSRFKFYKPCIRSVQVWPTCILRLGLKPYWSKIHNKKNVPIHQEIFDSPYRKPTLENLIDSILHDDIYSSGYKGKPWKRKTKNLLMR